MYLAYEEIEFDRNVESEVIWITPDDSYICYFIETDWKHRDNSEEKTKKFPFALENKEIDFDNFTP